jgi:hypothetical protein
MLGEGAPHLAPPMVWRETERINVDPRCGGHDDALTWGVIGTQAMIWAKAAGRHG